VRSEIARFTGNDRLETAHAVISRPNKLAQLPQSPRLIRIPCWKGRGADSEEKRELASDIDTVAVDSLNALDLEWPIREANC
jgi:hypothetical protein